jgi:bacterioferritin-associated ferredoxin
MCERQKPDHGAAGWPFADSSEQGVERKGVGAAWEELGAIVCSCNVLSDVQIRSAIASTAFRPRMHSVYASLGYAAKCGRCACTIKVMLDEIRRFATADGVAIEAVCLWHT